MRQRVAPSTRSDPEYQRLLGQLRELADHDARSPRWREFAERIAPRLRVSDVRSVQVAVRELTTSDPPGALLLAETLSRAVAGCAPALQSIALRARAQAVHLLARYRESADLHDELRATHEAAGELAGAASAELARIEALMYVDRPGEALEAAANANRLYGECGDRLGLAKVAINLGQVFHRLDRFKDALACFRRARPIFARRGHRAILATIDLNRALSWSLLGRSKTAIRLFAAAREDFARLDHRLGVANVDYNQSYDHFVNGRYDEAWRGLEGSREAFAALGDPQGQALVDLDMAEIALALGSPATALQASRRAGDGFARLDIPLELARARCFEAAALARSGSLADARAVLRDGIDAFDAQGHDVRAALARLDLAALSVDDQPDDAIRAARTARAPLLRAGFKNAAVRALILEGRASIRDHPKDAARLLRAANAKARRLAVPDVAWECAAALAQLDLDDGKLASACRRLERAADAIDQLRADVRRGDLAGWILDQRTEVYERAIRSWLEVGGTEGAEQALRYAERARSRSLADAIIAAGFAQGQRRRSATRPGRAAAREILALRRRLDDGYRLLFHHRRGARADDTIAAEIAVAESELAAALGPSAPFIERAEHTEAVPDAPTLCRSLQPGERMIEFQRLGDELWAFRMSADGVRADRIRATWSTVREQLAEVRFQIAKLNLGDGYASAHGPILLRSVDAALDRLGRSLLTPADLADDGTRHLTIVPSRELLQIPFAALSIDGVRLIERATISLAPSATVARLLRTRPSRACRPPLIVGLSDELIPAVDDEVGAISQSFPDARVLRGPEVQLDALRAEVVGRSVLHFATHGLFRPAQPTLSSLRLADGWMTLHDVFDLEVDADLVTLAACDSGQSAVVSGDEQLGLARGFLHAGAGSVLVSQWTLDDRTSRRVMTEFYRRYAAGESAVASLRAAMLQEKRQSKHPYHWAAFSLWGVPALDGRVPPKKNRRYSKARRPERELT